MQGSIAKAICDFPNLFSSNIIVFQNKMYLFITITLKILYVFYSEELIVTNTIFVPFMHIGVMNPPPHTTTN